MPRHYDYRCRACGHIELRYRNAQACRPCGSHEIERVRNEAPDTMLSAARTQIADLQRQLAEAQKRAERAEAACVALRAVLRACPVPGTPSMYTDYVRWYNERRTQGLGTDPGADFLDDAWRVYTALARYRDVPLMGGALLKVEADRALAAGKRRGWDKPAEGEEAGR